MYKGLTVTEFRLCRVRASGALWSWTAPLEEVGGRASETSRIPSEGHPDQRTVTQTARSFYAVSDEKPGQRPFRTQPE